jgi:hypothetical protein
MGLIEKIGEFSVFEHKKSLGFAVFAVLVWILFICLIASDLSYPWNVVNNILGILALFFWYKAINIDYEALYGQEEESTNARTVSLKAAISRAVYLALGFLSWGIFVFNIPPDPIYNPRPVFTGISGFVSSLFFIASVYLIIYSKPYRQGFLLNFTDPVSSGAHRLKDTRLITGWVLFIFGALSWSLFSDNLPRAVSGLNWNTLFFLTSLFAPWLLLMALFVRINIKRKSRRSEGSRTSAC